eukprot:196885-Alexandrium_andersonii.AAC.1
MGTPMSQSPVVEAPREARHFQGQVLVSRWGDFLEVLAWEKAGAQLARSAHSLLLLDSGLRPHNEIELNGMSR